jgi:hypothetical protein
VAACGEGTCAIQGKKQEECSIWVLFWGTFRCYLRVGVWAAFLFHSCVPVVYGF